MNRSSPPGEPLQLVLCPVPSCGLKVFAYAFRCRMIVGQSGFSLVAPPLPPG